MKIRTKHGEEKLKKNPTKSKVLDFNKKWKREEENIL
jgi:hypothetical protein